MCYLLHKNVVWESGVDKHFDAAFIDIFALKLNAQVNVEEKTLKLIIIILETSQTLVKMQRIDRERPFYCMRNFSLV